jgi:hypothetical protein
MCGCVQLIGVTSDDACSTEDNCSVDLMNKEDSHSLSVDDRNYRKIFINGFKLLRRFCRNCLTDWILLDGHTERITAIFYHQGVIATG